MKYLNIKLLILALAPIGSEAFSLASRKDTFSVKGGSPLASSLVEESATSDNTNILVPHDDEDLIFSIGNWEHDHRGLVHPDGYPTTQALALVHKMANRMAGGQTEVQDDLVQEGIVALMQSINNYPLLVNNKHEPFEIYAKRQIVLEMKKSLEGSLKLTPQISSILQSAERVRQRLSKQLKREPTLSEVAQVLKVKSNELQRYETMKQMIVQSVESTLETDDPDEVTKVFTDQDDDAQRRHVMTSRQHDAMWEEEDEEQVWLQPTASLKEVIVDRQELTPNAQVLQATIRTNVHDLCEEMLNDVELRVIRMHFGLDGEQALSTKETAKRLRTTKQFVQSIVTGAIEKLRTSPTQPSPMEDFL